VSVIRVTAKPKNIVPIHTGHITLGAFLKLAGAAETGGMARSLIAGGFVSVDGEGCAMRGKKLSKGMKVRVLGSNYYVG
jgi:ribosome-associated protein